MIETGRVSASYGMTARGKQIARVISAAVLLAAWALTIDGNFIRQRVQIDPNRANEVARMFDASWQEVRIDASDSVPLQGWLFTPSLANGRAVVFVHGRGGTRQSMLGRATPFLRVGYTCLLVDQRGSGTSGGVFSFGLREPTDLARWARWLRNRPQIRAVFGYGVSRGSTTLIQSLGEKPPLDGVAAESTGVGNISHPYQLAGDRLGVSEQTARLISWPLIEPSFAWVRARHGLDLREAPSGLHAIRSSDVPVLIVQGADDRDTPLAGAMRLRDANPQKVDLVVIPHADHDWFSTGKPEVIARILAWFEAHTTVR